ncbi:MAG: Metalloprotease MmpA [Alphaproteobacteria bacterium MarineAlpha5_Bin9]|nr:MAG: Metalloprotease MmpA [Alphaproteobacteria bacterium MarineAlpha5_Bin9]|tara:strand:+ start:1812 stop:2846 length:1035 start_codon:yes stop_codon:yes gene_type:complete
MIYFNLLIIFLFIIFIHEFGHYFFARLFKVKVTDFSIGFGKVLISYYDKNHTNWKISLIPLGGYVKIKGLESIFNNKPKTFNHNDSFEDISLLKKIIILLGGSLFNIISSWIIIISIFFFIGITKYEPIIGEVIKDSPAHINDLKNGDRIVKINDHKIDNFLDIGKFINKDEYVTIELLRGNSIITKNVRLNYNNELNKYFLGIRSNNKPNIIKYDFINSFIDSTYFIPTYYIQISKYIFNSYNSNTLSQELSGPIGIVKIADQLMLDKIIGILFMFISISLFVAIFNLIPIPLLDGGHILFFIIRRIFSNKLPQFIIKLYLAIGIAIISFIFILITFNDIFYK